MQTYSHLLITAVLGRKLKDREKGLAADEEPNKLPPTRTSALLIGSVAPDMLLILVSVAVIGYNLLAVTDTAVRSANIGYFFDVMYFEDPLIIALHSLLHAPFVIFALALWGWWGWKKARPWAPALFWFALACGLHSVIDIFTHVHDGPVIFFPFEWTIRFQAPVSYWDPAYGGLIFALLEHLLDLGIIIYLIMRWVKDRRASQARGLATQLTNELRAKSPQQGTTP
jgi:membrane-bound metal-dependent hydrolase YbcI (DUF457 family)